ncbi:MAG: PQQ-binding-like beta-propeller repeat protein [Oscillospiraceae bacterium]|nr:PQQ-binding-like beta-propeller repeat protein [Oscillospiraceae bacterium]
MDNYDHRRREAGRRFRRRRARRNTLRALLVLVCLTCLIAAPLLFISWLNSDPDAPDISDAPDTIETPENTPPALNLTPWEDFHPHSLPGTDPQRTNFGFQWDTQIVGDLGPIHFGWPEDYSNLAGITTFRGNNFRNQAAWSTVDIVEERLVERYMLGTGRMGDWSGVGWSGQPAIVQWDFELQQQMNIVPSKRDNPDLVEVIQGVMDGYIYFFDLADGVQTRPPIRLGEPIKGGVTVDPRGYPLLYVGQGVMFGDQFGFFIYSLIDGSELFFIDGHDPFAPRDWGAFDANPVIDKVNDRMILVGENGVIYSVLLNTTFDRAAGTIGISPVVSRYRHTTTPHRGMYGMESSPAAFSHYLFVADNSGIIQCIDLRTLEPVWVFDSGDDTDATLVLDWEEEHQRLVLYTGTSVDLQGPGGYAFVRKLDAATGAVLWEHAYPCRHNPDVNGGVMGTPVLGKEDIADLVIFSIAKPIGVGGNNLLVAYDRESGAVVWETPMVYYAWSSPVAVYTPDGRSYLVLADQQGHLHLIRGRTGEIVYSLQLYGTIEASPAVFGNQIVIGTRWLRIFGVEIL